MENKKYVYLRENLTLLIIIALIVELPLIIIGVIAMIMSPEWFILIPILSGPIILFLILLGLYIYKLKWRRWHDEAIKSETKFNGKVLHVCHVHRRADLRNNIPSIEQYSFTVLYIDDSGKEKIFETPTLAFKLKNTNDMTCDVYIYKDKEFATNFINMKKS